MKLLVAEDDLTSRAMLVAIARKWKYEVSVAADGEEAWNLLQDKDAPKLLLIDWEMPKVDGLELCRRIRDRGGTCSPYIVLLTGRSKTEDVVAGLQAGANDYVAKPYANAELQARLNVGKRMLEMQAQLNAAQQILVNEREVIESILLKVRESHSFEGTDLRQLQAPVEKTSGDILLSETRPDGSRHIMLGDFTGHGLMAAVCAPVVFDVFYAMTAKGLDPGVIMAEMNKHLLSKMPTGLFLALVFLEYHPETKLARIWNCGMSDVLICRQNRVSERFSSSLLSLGIIDQAYKPTVKRTMQPEDRIYAFSDGIIETVNPDGEEFGQNRLEATLEELLDSGQEIEFISKTVNVFRGDAGQFDDITLVELTC